MTARVAKLTRGQLDCLLLVDQHLSSKEIAAELNISPHTVDQRIRIALQTLGVERRAQAARIVARHHEPYQRLIHQSPYIEGPLPAEHSDGRSVIRFGTLIAQGRPGTGPQYRAEIRAIPVSLAFAVRNEEPPRNEMSVGLRLLWIFLIATGAAFSAGMYLAGLESLARLLKS
ncbi:helix-turn-helix transcriptional regulator [Sphingomonas sediminicola]|uniref:Helix-turn-helix transcriptional regulator n=1 Tax=Sphingomonas sediminicola TaxID=386874 RepID=A0ABX6TBX9_9SPHN|nr:helix-turn-helix transcriptional regulator [Sphingomonas sediminicola]QNP45138.1 helix-turn-helix transcriptional regulator [Sphingomonas sediminicola]